jgi:hypothetical protein
MGKWLEISIEEDRYGNCINREERADVFIDVVEEDNYIHPTYEDSHYITKTNTYFYEKTHYHYMTFYYKIIEAVYNEKNDLIRETTKNLDGKITKEILCDYEFDEFGNKIYEIIKTRIDNECTKENKICYTYDNKYNEYGQLVGCIKKTTEEEIIFTKEYRYKNHRLDRIETYDSKNVLCEVSEFYYDSNDYFEEKILSFKGLSCYKQHSLLEDKRYKIIMLNPIKGMYKWSIDSKDIEKGIINVDIFEPILIPDAIIEILGYVTERYGDRINSIVIKKNDSINIDLFKDDLDKLYKVYYIEYRLDIKYC